MVFNDSDAIAKSIIGRAIEIALQHGAI